MKTLKLSLKDYIDDVNLYKPIPGFDSIDMNKKVKFTEFAPRVFAKVRRDLGYNNDMIAE